MVDPEVNRCPEVHISGARCTGLIGHEITHPPATRRHSGVDDDGHYHRWVTPT